jgi:hypothetical protein
MTCCIDFPDSRVQHCSRRVWICYRGRRENWICRQDMVHDMGGRLGLLGQERGWHLHSPLCLFEFRAGAMPRCFNLICYGMPNLVRVV